MNFSNNDFQTLSRYKEQLNLYKFALSKKTGIPVKECILYSFTTGKEIKQRWNWWNKLRIITQCKKNFQNTIKAHVEGSAKPENLKSSI